jgi:hypothetical protein
MVDVSGLGDPVMWPISVVAVLTVAALIRGGFVRPDVAMVTK